MVTTILKMYLKTLNLVLNNNGLIIFDDFNWRYSFNLSNNPGLGIIKFYKKYKKNLKIIYVGYQILFMKITD